jgi:uncharacterized delta-60 repeat protein
MTLLSRKRDRQATIEPLELRRLLAAAGRLDPEFGNFGTVITDVQLGQPGPDHGTVVLPMSDGRVVLAGDSRVGDDFARGEIARYKVNGTLDDTFGQGGVAQIGVPGWDDFTPTDAALLGDDGTILVLGQVHRIVAASPEDREEAGMVLVSVSPSGVPDFGGATHIAASDTLTPWSHLLRQNDGKVLITGRTTNGTETFADDQALVSRLSPPGVQDSFGDGGTLVIPSIFKSRELGATPRGIALRDNGFVDITGRDGDSVVEIFQLDNLGHVDTTFGGGDGHVDIRNDTWQFDTIAAAPSPDGGFFAAAWKPKNALPLSIVKLKADGTVDATFSNGTFPEPVFALGAQMVVQSDGKIVIASNTADFHDRTERMDPIVVRFNANGTRDTSFGPTGEGYFRFVTDRENNSRVNSLALSNSPGTIYAGGTADNKILVFRLENDVNDGLPPSATNTVSADLTVDRVLNIVGTAGRDVIVLHTAVDPLAGNSIKVTVNGGVTKTFPVAAVRSILALAGEGDDAVDARELDTIVTPGVDFPVTIDGQGGNDTLVGSYGRDRITGGDGKDKIHGWVGNDWLSGNAQSDRVGGGESDDLVLGNGGRDFLDGGNGDDSMFGGDQPDTLIGGAGNDSMLGEGGHDRIFGDAGVDWLSGGGGNDTIFARDGEIDTVVGGLLGDDHAQTDANDIVAGIEVLI